MSLLAAALGLASSQRPAAARPLWFRTTTIRDMRGDGRPDTLVVVAYGRRADSLDVVFTIRGGGRELFRERWNSWDEFIDERDSLDRNTLPADSLARLERGKLEKSFAATNFGTATSLGWARRWPPVTLDCEGDPRDCIAFQVRLAAAVAARLAAGLDSLPPRDEERVAFYNRLSKAPFDTARVQRIAREMRERVVPTFTFSYGYETIRTIAWSPTARRFFDVSVGE